MIQIKLKAKHFYFIAYLLKNLSIQQYFSLINRIKTQLLNNTDLDILFTIDATVEEIVTIFKILSNLPEGRVNKINVEMDDLLVAQIETGIQQEISNGTIADQEGNLPENAYWQWVAKEITAIKAGNTETRNEIIIQGKNFIDTL